MKKSAERKEIEAVIDSYDSSEYDTEAMRTDAENNNFSPDRADEYRHTEIVANDIVNGQFKQARDHCTRFGLIYEQQMIANGRDPWK